MWAVTEWTDMRQQTQQSELGRSSLEDRQEYRMAMSMGARIDEMLEMAKDEYDQMGLLKRQLEDTRKGWLESGGSQ